MSQRNSEYARRTGDDYSTPHWCTAVIVDLLHERRVRSVLEPCPGEGRMVRSLISCGFSVEGCNTDFLTANGFKRHDAVVGNPPYSHACEFIEKALMLTRPVNGMVCLLLPVNYDCATRSRRTRLFEPPFVTKIILRRRITWIARTDGVKEAPSSNHAWFIWDWRAPKTPPTIRYYPEHSDG
jgi:hypothetical protein